MKKEIILGTLMLLAVAMTGGCASKKTDSSQNSQNQGNLQGGQGQNQGSSQDNQNAGNQNQNSSQGGQSQNQGNQSTDNSADTAPELSKEEIIEQLCANVDVPPYETVTLDKTNFEFFTFVPFEEGLSAVAADALVNITPHSLVLIHSDNGGAGEIAARVAANADMNKWLCVGSEAGNVIYTDHYVVLIMSEKSVVDGITENFEAMAARLDTGKPEKIVLSNSRYEQ